MHVERMTDCIKRLRLLDDSRFDMSDWFTIREDQDWSAFDEVKCDTPDCNSSACIIGWCCRWYPNDWSYSTHIGPMYCGRANFEAAKKWFELGSGISYWLFGTSEGTPTEVADRLQEYMDEQIKIQRRGQKITTCAS